jgi:tRNA nucleotidyltransferase (CCA-adding enzyme)
MLLHDIGKPFSCQEDGNTRHFKGHAKISAEMAYTIMKRLKYDNATLNMVVNLIKHHSDKFESEKQIKHTLSALGEDIFFKLIEVKKADNLAKKDFCAERIPKLENVKKQAEDIINANSCLKISDLKINGNDLKKLGLKGKRIGEILALLLDMVIEDKIENEYSSLISYVKKL